MKLFMGKETRGNYVEKWHNNSMIKERRVQNSDMYVSAVISSMKVTTV
jgi:hypothetical protein